MLTIVLIFSVLGDPQSFIVAPSNQSVIQGQTAVLKCQVAHKKGALQWTKDGFALGKCTLCKNGNNGKDHEFMILENIIQDHEPCLYKTHRGHCIIT